MFELLIAIVLIAFFVIARRDTKLALVALAALLPTYLVRFSVGPVPVTLLEGLVIILILVWIARGGLKKTNRRTIPWLRPALLLLAAASFGVAVAPDSVSALGIWKAYFVEPVIIAIIAHQTLKTKDDWRNLFAGLFAGAFFIGLVALLQFVSGIGIPAPWDLERRVTGVYDFPNAVGLFLAPITVLAIASSIDFFKTNRSELKKTLALSAAVFGTIGFILSRTEAAFVAVPAALLAVLVLSGAKKNTKILASATVAAVTIILIAAVPAVRSKLLLQDYSGQVRLAQWSETTDMLQINPVFGAGLNSYPQALEPHHDPTFFEIFQYPHNIFLNIWSELGLLGLAAFFWLAWLVLKRVREQSDDPVVLAAFAALAVMTIHGLVDVPYFKNDLAILTWLLIAAVFAEKKSKILNP